MDRAKWLEWRRGGLGSSDAPVLMNESPWKTKYDLYKEKVFGDVIEEDNDAMKWGREKEPEVRSWLEEKYEMFLEPRNMEHPIQKWQRASLDAMNFTGSKVFEIKCPYRNGDDHAMAKAGKVPRKYAFQLLHQMLVTGLEEITFVSFFKEDYAIVDFKMDVNHARELAKEESKFWMEFVLPKNPPALTDKDHREMEHNHEWSLCAFEWKNAKSKLSEVEKDEEFYRKKLIELALGKSSTGCGVRLTGSERKGNIDYEKAIGDYKMAIVADNPSIELPDLNLEDYRKSSTLTHRLSMY